MMSSYNRGWSRVVGFPAGAGHMHDLFAVSRMHYDMAGYRIARPPMGWADSFWLLLLACLAACAAISLIAKACIKGHAAMCKPKRITR